MMWFSYYYSVCKTFVDSNLWSVCFWRQKSLSLLVWLLCHWIDVTLSEKHRKLFSHNLNDLYHQIIFDSEPKWMRTKCLIEINFFFSFESIVKWIYFVMILKLLQNVLFALNGIKCHLIIDFLLILLFSTLKTNSGYCFLMSFFYS